MFDEAFTSPTWERIQITHMALSTYTRSNILDCLDIRSVYFSISRAEDPTCKEAAIERYDTIYGSRGAEKKEYEINRNFDNWIYLNDYFNINHHLGLMVGSELESGSKTGQVCFLVS